MTTTPSHVLLVTGSRTWDEEERMRSAFHDLWQTWGPPAVTHPMLVSGGCPDGADAMAERLFKAEGFGVTTMPADWSAHGPAAGPKRNRQMIDHASMLRRRGCRVAVAAFLDLCTKDGCRSREEQQLLAETGLRGHFSHGTIHCRNRAVAADLPVMDVPHPNLPPF